MIPPELDDGFTVEVFEGVYARKALHEDKPRIVADPLSAFRPPFVFGQSDEQEQLARYVLSLSVQEERRMFQRLADTVSLQVQNPGMLALRCSDCLKYCVDHETGEVQIDAVGRHKLKPPGIQVPCESGFGCVKGHHTNPISANDNPFMLTWRHWWRYKGVSTPLDTCSTYLRNRSLLSWIVDYGRHRRFDPFVGNNASR